LIKDKEGKVTSAKEEGGHPLLRKAAVAAARQSLFESSVNTDEREAKLTYVFLDDGNEKLKHYSNPYQLEITSYYAAIDSSSN
jgi:hypothetical protein